MKNSIKNTLALLIVFGATMANAVDSAYMATNCKIVAEEEKLYRIEYLAASDQQVTIQLFDKQNVLVHKEIVQSASFVKTFDLTSLPNGQYEFVVSSDDYSYREEILIDDLRGFAFMFSQRESRKVSMIGTKHQGKEVDLFIMDANQEIVYQRNYKEGTQLHKVFNFEQLYGNEVTFLIFHDNHLITEERITF